MECIKFVFALSLHTTKVALRAEFLLCALCIDFAEFVEFVDVYSCVIKYLM